MFIRRCFLAAALAGLLSSSIRAAGDAEQTQKLIAVLQSSDAGLFEKARACQRLGEIGTGEAVPALAALLADEHLNAYARSGLEGIPDPRAAAALRSAATALKGKPLVGVIDSLGVLRDVEAIGILQKLAADPEFATAKAALLALGRIATPESIQVIRRALADSPEPVRAEAAAACLLAAEKLLTDGNISTASSLYDAVRNANVPVSYRIGATRGAILARDADRVPFLIEQMRSDERAIRHAALLAIREIPGDALAEALNEELAKADPEMEIQLLHALADCHNTRSVPAIRAKLTGGTPEFRKAALSALGKIDGQASADALLEVLLAPRDSEETRLAFSSLEQLQERSVDDRILSALKDAREAGGQIQLMRLASARGLASATDQLLKLAGSSEPRVASAAFSALASLAGAKELPALVSSGRTTTDEVVREAVESAIVRTAKRTASTEAAGRMVLAELRRAEQSEAKNSWIRILAALGYAEALPDIEAAVKDADEEVAANAIEQLGLWPDPTPIESLFAVVEKGADAAQRRRALISALQLATAAAEQQQRPADVVAGWFKRAAKAAQNVEARRRVLSGLGRLNSPESFRLILPYLDDEAVRAEAAAAIIQIAPALLKGTDGNEVREALKKIAATAPHPELRAQARKLIER